MSFEPIMPQVNTVRSGPDEVSLALYGKEDVFSVSIKLGRNVMRELHWKHGDRILITEGAGADAGLLQLLRVSRGGYGIAVHNLVQGRDRSEFDGVIKCLARKFEHYVTPLQPRSQEAVPYEVKDGILLMLVPDWMTPKDTKRMREYEKNRAKGLGGQAPIDSPSKAPAPHDLIPA